MHQLMDQYEIDAIVASTPENLLYFADYSPWQMWTYRGNTAAKGTQAYAIIPRRTDMKPAVVPIGANYTALVYPAQFPGWVTEFYPYHNVNSWPGEIPDVPFEDDQPDTPQEVIRLRALTEKFKPNATSSAGEALVKALRDRDLEKGTIAIETYGFNAAVLDYLKRELPELVLKEGAEFMRMIRAVKTPQEIFYLRRAGEINEKAFQHILNLMHPGISTAELALEHRKILAAEGAYPSFLNISVAGHPGTMFEPNNYKLRKGDVVWMDGGCYFNHYHADTGLCLAVGEPTKRMREVWDAIEEALAAAKAVCRPGNRSSEVYNAMHVILQKHGFKVPFAMGHGIGLEERDYPLALGNSGNIGVGQNIDFNDPILTGSKDLILEPNMVMCVEPVCFEWGTGGIKAEETVLITPTGYEMLFAHERIFTINR